MKLSETPVLPIDSRTSFNWGSTSSRDKRAIFTRRITISTVIQTRIQIVMLTFVHPLSHTRHCCDNFTYGGRARRPFVINAHFSTPSLSIMQPVAAIICIDYNDIDNSANTIHGDYLLKADANYFITIQWRTHHASHNASSQKSQSCFSASGERIGLLSNEPYNRDQVAKAKNTCCWFTHERFSDQPIGFVLTMWHDVTWRTTPIATQMYLHWTKMSKVIVFLNRHTSKFFTVRLVEPRRDSGVMPKDQYFKKLTTEKWRHWIATVLAPLFNTYITIAIW